VSGSMSVAARAWRSLERGMEVAGSGVGAVGGGGAEVCDKGCGRLRGEA